MKDWYSWPMHGSALPLKECAAAWLVAASLVLALAAMADVHF